MAEQEMKIRASMDGDRTMVKAILFHPMETGLRKDSKTGNVIPAHFIREVTCKHGDKTILTCLWGTAVSKNPFIAFRFQGGKSGDNIKITWVDNKGNSETAEAKIS